MNNYVESNINYALLPHIELIGNNQCKIDGLNKISEYTSTGIKIDLGKFVAKISGFDLSVDSFFKNGALITGTITNIELINND